MSKVGKKGKVAQQRLDLLDPAVQQEQASDLDFVLKIHDGHLHDLEIEETFTQAESLDRLLTRLQKGRDKSDHINIFNNGVDVPAQCSKKLLELYPYFNTEKSLRFEGGVIYLSKFNSYQLMFKKYIINRFHVIENVSLEEWIDDFRAKGTLNWSIHYDRVGGWLI